MTMATIIESLMMIIMTITLPPIHFSLIDDEFRFRIGSSSTSSSKMLSSFSTSSSSSSSPPSSSIHSAFHISGFRPTSKDYRVGFSVLLPPYFVTPNKNTSCSTVLSASVYYPTSQNDTNALYSGKSLGEWWIPVRCINNSTSLQQFSSALRDQTINS